MKPESKVAKARRQIELEIHALEELGDIIRVQIHLGGMELKDAWRVLEPRIAHVSARARAEIEAAGAAVAEEVTGRIEHLADALEELREKLVSRGDSHTRVTRVRFPAPPARRLGGPARGASGTGASGRARRRRARPSRPARRG